MNDIFENTEIMQENEHPRFYTAESVMRGHPDKLCDLIADSVLDACLQHDPASRVACEVMATHGHIIVAGEITTSAKPDVFNIVRDTLRDVGYAVQQKGFLSDVNAVGGGLLRRLGRTLAVQTRELLAAEYAVAVPSAKKQSRQQERG